ncbi:MAG: hypothetical protein EA377_08595 [Phycisphaerales bacterium]|nr:MAG: hypothetical protein EA377_08595 [Phycisphaerales bacterium]
MNLHELCNPFFQYICRINRLSRSRADLPASQIREEIKAIIERLREQAAETPGLLQQFEIREGVNGKRGIELVLLFFADFMIRESPLRCASEWEDLAAEHEEHSGYDKFFVMLDETLEDKSPDAKGRIAVYYTCMGLGFTGGLSDEPEKFNRKLRECAARLRTYMDESAAQRVCDEAYVHTDRRPLDVPPVERVVNRVLLFAAVFFMVLVAGGVLYHFQIKELNTALSSIQSQLEGATTEGGGGR